MNDEDFFTKNLINFTTLIVNLSHYASLFKSINILDPIMSTPNSSLLDDSSTKLSSLPSVAIILISCLMFLTILKIIVIYLSYYFIIIPKAIFNLIKALIKTKCQIRLDLVLTKIAKTALTHLHTFYSYNFYSYTDSISGVILVLQYIAFIVSIILMSVFYVVENQWPPNSLLKNFIYMIHFFLQLFFQFYIPFYYYARKNRKFLFYFSTTFLFVIFGIGLSAYVINNVIPDSNHQNFFYICFSIGYHLLLFVIEMFTLKKLLRYDKHKKSMKMLLAESINIKKILISVNKDKEKDKDKDAISTEGNAKDKEQEVISNGIDLNQRGDSEPIINYKMTISSNNDDHEHDNLNNPISRSSSIAVNSIRKNKVDPFILHRLTNKYHLTKFYCNSQSRLFFKTIDRFHRKTFLLYCFIIYCAIHILLICFLTSLACAKQSSSPKVKNEFFPIFQGFLFVETALLNILTWMTFMKFEISTLYLY